MCPPIVKVSTAIIIDINTSPVDAILLVAVSFPEGRSDYVYMQRIDKDRLEIEKMPFVTPKICAICCLAGKNRDSIRALAYSLNYIARGSGAISFPFVLKGRYQKCLWHN